MVDNVNIMVQKVDNVNQSRRAPGLRAGGDASGGTGSTVASGVVERLHKLMHRMKRRLQQAATTEGEGLAPMEVRALAFFARHPGSSAGDLVAHAGRDKAQVARLVKLLLDRGLLAATPAAEDRRRLQLLPTDSGLAIERRMAAQRRRIERELLAGFSAAEAQALGLALDRLLAALAED